MFGDDDCSICYETSGFMLKFIIVGLIILIGSIYYTKVFLQTENEIFFIESLPTLETNEATDDVPFSGHGNIRFKDNTFLISPYTRTKCVYYHSITEKLVKTSKNNKWVIETEEFNHVPFYIEDERGKLLVDITDFDNDLSGFKIKETRSNRPDPDKSEIDSTALMKFQDYKSENYSIWNNPKRRRSEFALLEGTYVFAYGEVDRINGELVLKESKQHPLIISKKTKEEFIKEFYKGKNLIYITHFLTAIGFSMSLLASNYFLKLGDFVLFPLLFTGNFLIVGSIIVTIHNRIEVLRQRALSALSNINVELERRARLIPNIISVVKEFSVHEKYIQKFTAQARAHTSFVKSMPVKNDNLIKSIIAVAEAYPDLKSSQNYNALVTELVDTEERIAYSRSFYNKNVGKINTMIAQFPFNLVASYVNAKPMDYLSISNM